jgi:ATP-dependent Lon protease
LLKNSDLFHDMPQTYRNEDGQAILDRIHYFLPGWEIDILRNELFSDGYGFVVDYLAEVLRSLRDHDFSDRYQKYFTLSSDVSTRDREGINKTFAGLMKLMYPNGEATEQETAELLQFAIEGRKRVKDQLMRIDATYTKVNFAYCDKSGKEIQVKTLEEKEYSDFYHKCKLNADNSNENLEESSEREIIPAKKELPEQHKTIEENQKGISYDRLFGEYLVDATSVTITDPYIRNFYQIKNLMDFIEVIVRHKKPDEQNKIKLITIEDDFKGESQTANFEKIKEECQRVGIDFTWKYAPNGSIHARHIVTDHGWKIALDRGLDIFQPYDINDLLSLTNRLQQFRPCKAFEVTFIKSKP